VQLPFYEVSQPPAHKNLTLFFTLGRPAEQQLEEWRNNNYADFCRGLAAEISADDKPQNARGYACMSFKNSLYIKNTVQQKIAQDRWKALPSDLRGLVKQALLKAIRSGVQQLSHLSALAASEIAAVELPYHEWPEFIPVMMENVTTAAAQEATVLASLDCLGYTCERAATHEETYEDTPSFEKKVVDSMLTTIVDAVQPQRSIKVRLSSLTALKNSLVFVGPNMDVPEERSFIFQAIQQATQAQDAQNPSAAAKVREMAFQCYDSIAELYYSILPEFMTVIFEATSATIGGDGEELVTMAAVEFWSTLSAVEQTLLDEEQGVIEDQQQQTGHALDDAAARAAAAAQLGRDSCPRYTLAAAPRLVPMLLHLLKATQDEDAEFSAWNLHAASGSCLASISQTIGAAVIPVVFPFVTAHIRSNDWRERDAAIAALGCILEGPSTQEIGQIVVEAVPIVVEALPFPNVLVQESATFCLSQIFLHHLSAVPNFPVVVQAIMTKLQQVDTPPRVATQAAAAINNLAASVLRLEQEQGTVAPTNCLSVAILPLLQALFTTSDRPDADEANLRSDCMLAATSVIDAAAYDQLPVLQNVVPEVIGRMEKCLLKHAQASSSEERESLERVLGSLCAMILTLYQKLHSLVDDQSPIAPQHSKQIIELLSKTMEIQNSNCFEEAIMAVGSIASNLGQQFMVSA
jgi:importin subunit beta-1